MATTPPSTSTAPSLPSAAPIIVSLNITLQPPLSRCGRGPGLLLIRPTNLTTCQANNTSLDPSPVQKWAEESFVVVELTLDSTISGDGSSVSEAISAALDSLRTSPQCDDPEKIGLLVYGSPTDYHPAFPQLLRQTITALATTVAVQKIVAIVYFSSAWEEDHPREIPALLHLPTPPSKDTILPLGPPGINVDTTSNRRSYYYPEAQSPGFIIPGHANFKIGAAGVAHTRSLTFLKRTLGGPYFDLEKIWEEHTYYEFGDRSVEKTMATMVQEPYVNHVPTMTGGTGRVQLSRFYLEHFIFTNPEDTELELVSRTVGIDRVVDEFIFCLTHNAVVDWLIPGIPPTHKPLRIPFTSVVNIRGDRLYHEHIAWDQATVLRQLGLLPEYLPYPYALPSGQVAAPGKRFEYRVPAAGAETARKLQGDHSVPSNEMFAFEVREVDL
ncbi:uncharacterized protein BP01DRAFT_355385 [Aspergillus saccharolyticus JOP 1030-1]|uniref:Carboxymethylenebutenolidase n=1 Tax=Aspergillus saccharolyticus JOP 1030-1 TaxID=1450539 RepID=A0A318ZSP6_9EURO|nr:hypothetical protein BP01DRAFT_355385 [Aspergillus saccharolyticus JOP 1030-1]PYH46980.1 hypothetical protein BP01DRAFT_355385 [Aspergillus saccharolyticus JOP 1030-1]